MDHSNRCNVCRKKVGLLGFECQSCKNTFCTSHRYLDAHGPACRAMQILIEGAKKNLANANPKITSVKVQPI